MAEAMPELPVQVPIDPDAQATVTDFLDYTEYLPADLVRSLTLIRKLDDTYIAHSSHVHQLAKIYGALPSIPSHARPEPQLLRKGLATCLARAINTRGSAFAEASRLHDVVDHHYSRLASIVSKLQALPLPPSRDPTPVPASTTTAPSPQTQRPSGGHHGGGGSAAAEDVDAPAPRITLRLDGARSAVARAAAAAGTGARKHRPRRVTIPGDVLPPPEVDSPRASTESEWDSPPSSPVPVATSRVGGPARPIRSTPATHKPLKAPKPLKPPKPPKATPSASARPPAPQPWNDAIAGPIVLTAPGRHSIPPPTQTPPAPKPPPPNAVPGSEDAPWLRLTPWEMGKLRKRMKKNAVWCPSETMVRRELAELGRGPEAYHAARALAQATGEPFVDTANIADTLNRPGKRALAEGEISADSLGQDEIQLSNRGMKLNEAKKLKKENLQRELAAQAAAEAEDAARRLALGIDHPTIVEHHLTEMSGGAAAAATPVPAVVPPTPVPSSLIPIAPMVAPVVKDSEPEPSDKKRKRVSVSGAEGNKSTCRTAAATAAKKRKREAAMATAAAAAAAAAASTAASASRGGGSGTDDNQTTNATPVKLPAVTPAPTATTSTTTMTVPLAAPGSLTDEPAVTAVATEMPTPIGSTTRRQASTTSKAVTPEQASTTRPRSRRTTTPAETEVVSAAKDRPRRASTISTAPVPPRRSKRPVPGRLTGGGSEGGPAVTVGRRSAAPRKKTGGKKLKGGEATTTAAAGLDDEVDDENFPVDPDEPRYCFCERVSFGEMIECEHVDVCRLILLFPSPSFLSLFFFFFFFFGGGIRFFRPDPPPEKRRCRPVSTNETDGGVSQ